MQTSYILTLILKMQTSSPQKEPLQISQKHFSPNELYQDHAFSYLNCKIDYDFEQLSKLCDFKEIKYQLKFKRTALMILHKAMSWLNKEDKRLPRFQKSVTKTALCAGQS